MFHNNNNLTFMNTSLHQPDHSEAKTVPMFKPREPIPGLVSPERAFEIVTRTENAVTMILEAAHVGKSMDEKGWQDLVKKLKVKYPFVGKELDGQYRKNGQHLVRSPQMAANRAIERGGLVNSIACLRDDTEHMTKAQIEDTQRLLRIAKCNLLADSVNDLLAKKQMAEKKPV